MTRHRIFFLYVSVLLFVPLAKIPISPPLYFLDILAALGIALSLSARREPLGAPYLKLTAFCAITMLVLVELNSTIGAGYLVEGLYTSLRYAINGVYIIFFAMTALSHRYSLEKLAYLIVVASTLNAIVVISFALPVTRSIVAALLFENPILFPGRSWMDPGAEAIGLGVTRGESLVGGPTLQSAWLATGFATALWLLTGKKGARGLLLLATVALALGLIVTFSRSAWLALALVLTVHMVRFNARSSVILLGGVVASIGFYWLSLSYELEMLSRFDSDFQSLDRYTNRARLLSYVTPIPYAMENPDYLISGPGVTLTSKVDNLEIYSFGDGRGHSFFGGAFYRYGLIFSGLVCVYFLTRILSGFRRVFTKNKNSAFSLSLLMSIAPAFATDHFFIGTVRGFALLLFIFTLSAIAVVAPKTQLRRYPQARFDMREMRRLKRAHLSRETDLAK